MKQSKKYHKDLFEAFKTASKNPRRLHLFLKDILTPAEYDDILLRLQIIKLLKKGVTQRAIARNLGISIAKITRGSRVLLNKKGGFNMLFGSTKK